jgi:phytoene dehydrogenase-like protein
MGRVLTVGIIGGGVSGLSAGTLLVRRGMRVKLFEANDKLGGCCGTTRTGGYIFDDGAVYLGFPAVLDRVFGRLGLDRPSVLPLKKAGGHRSVLPDGTTVSLAHGFRIHVGKGTEAADGKELRKEVTEARKKWEPVLRLFEDEIFTHPFSLPRMIPKLLPHLHKLRGTVGSEITKLFSSEAVRAAMAGALLITGTSTRETPVALILGLVSLLSEGFYLPEGGMGRIPETLGQAFRDEGGEVFLGSRVQRILVKDGRVCGVEIDGQGRVDVDAVISTASGMATVGLLPDPVPDEMRRKAENAPLSHCALSIQLGLSNVVHKCSQSNSIVQSIESEARNPGPGTDGAGSILYLVPTLTAPELARPGGSIIEMFLTAGEGATADEWDDERTEGMVESAIEALESQHRLDIAEKRVLAPRDFRDRLNLYKGALYGLSPAAPGAQFPHATPIPGLYQAGQTTYPGFGVPQAAMSGIFAADRLMEDESFPRGVRAEGRARGRKA